MTPTGVEIIEPHFLCWDSSEDKTIGVVDIGKLAPAIDAAIAAAIAEAKRDANREACDLCHCCGEKRHDGGDPCVSCARAIAEAQEATIKKYQAWQERVGPGVIVPWQVIFVGDTALTPEDIRRGQEIDTTIRAQP